MKKLRNPFMIAGIILGFVLSSSTLKCSSAAHGEEYRAIDDYKLFKTVQRIYAIIDQEIGTSAKHGQEVSRGKDGWQKPNFYYRRTKQGLFLLQAKQLYSPWGTIWLSCNGNLGFEQRVLQHFTTTFSHIGENYMGYKDEVTYGVLQLPADLTTLFEKEEYPAREDSHSMLRPIFEYVSLGDIAKRAGQNIFVTCPISGFDPIYKIHAIQGHPLPEPEFTDSSDGITSREVQAAWQRLNARFEKERELDS